MTADRVSTTSRGAEGANDGRETASTELRIGATRRRFLASTVGVATLAGCAASTSGERAGDTADDPEPTDGETPLGREEDGGDEAFPDGAVAFVYDDGPMTDYEQALPAHRAFDAPATVCVVSEWIGTSRSVGEMMDVEHLEELVAEGWEVASHTTGHETLGSFSLTADAAAADTRVYPTETRHGHHPRKEVEVTDGTRTVTNTVAGSGRDADGEAYVELAEPIGADFEAGAAEIRHSPERMRSVLGDSKRDLEALGFEVDTLLAPYDLFDDYSARFASQYYDVVANGDHGSIVNYPGDFDPLRTRRGYFVEFTGRETVKGALDEVAATGGLGVLGAHTFKAEVTEARIRETLAWVDERDLEVLTTGEAARRFERHLD